MGRGRGRRLGFGLMVLLGVGVGVAEQKQRSPAAAKSAAQGSYRIAGKVVDAHSGAALAHCSVQIDDVKERTQPRTVTSRDDGSFSFDGLALGKYSLTAQRHGYLAQSYEEHGQYSTAIAVGPGLESEDLIFKITSEGIIAGTITDETGEPIRGAQVRLFQDDDSTGVRTTRQRQQVTTDDLGMYEISGLKPGSYFLVATAHPWYAQRLRQTSAADDSSNGTTQPLEVAYPTTFYPGVTDQDAATPIPIKGGDRLEANLTLAAQTSLRLRVKMPSGETGNGGVSISLSQSIFGQAEMQPLTMSGIPGSRDIEVEGVLPGHYDVTMNHFTPGQGEGASKHFSADISGGTTEVTEDAAIDAVTVTGKVTSAAGKLPERAGISLRMPNSNSRRNQYAQLNETGEFTLEVSPGTYEVLGNIEGMHFESLKAMGAQLAGRMLTIKSGDAPKLEIVAGTGHGEIEGNAVMNGKPASAVLVILVPEDPGNNTILFRRDQSDSDGTFTLSNIFPGRYHLLAIADGWELEWANPAVLQAFMAKSVPVVIKSGDELKQTIEVQSR